MFEPAGCCVMAVTALGDDLNSARAHAYDAIKTLAGRSGTGALTYRRDIDEL